MHSPPQSLVRRSLLVLSVFSLGVFAACSDSPTGFEVPSEDDPATADGDRADAYELPPIYVPVCQYGGTYPNCEQKPIDGGGGDGGDPGEGGSGGGSEPPPGDDGGGDDDYQCPSTSTSPGDAQISNVDRRCADDPVMVCEPGAAEYDWEGCPAPEGVDNEWWARINEHEKKVCLANLAYCAAASVMTVDIFYWSNNLDYGPQENGENDAIRHCTWSASLHYTFPTPWAQDLLYAHEVPYLGSEASDMDFNNNAVGAVIGEQLQSLGSMSPVYDSKQLCVDALLNDQLTVLNPKPQ